jgi:uncharacterized protein YbaR (Trm112 family)
MPAAAAGAPHDAEPTSMTEAPIMTDTQGDASPALPHPSIEPRLLEILVCPVTRGPLSWDPAAQELISRQARLAYPVRDGIPIMLPDEARPLDGAGPA